MRYPKFKGWDWTEVTDYFNKSKKFDYKTPTKEPKETAEEYENRIIEDFKKWTWASRNNKVAVKVCRLYTKSILDQSSKIDYIAPLWKGLGNIEHDETFIIYFNILLQGMWT